MKYDLENRLINFSVSVIGISEFLINSIASNHLYKQIVRSATAVPLNYAESESSESVKDFVHKMLLSLKELRETKVNLLILIRSNHLEIEKGKIELILKENIELISILAKSVKTTKLKYNL